MSSSFERNQTMAEQMSDRTADRAEQSLRTTRRAAQDSLDSMQQGVARTRENVTQAVNSAADRVESATRQGIERAREMSETMRDQMTRASDQTAEYIREEPMKAVLIAAAAGALVALLVNAMSRNDRRYRM